jgi:hypothetical protein
MGCWDVFCFLCGNPCHGSHDLTEIFLDSIKYYEEIKDSKNKKNKFMQKELKPIYDYHVKHPEFVKEIKSYEKLTNWMNNNTFLTMDNKIVHNCRETSCNIDFIDSKGNKYIHSDKEYLDENYGVFVHTDCWNYVKSEYKISLNFSYLPLVSSIYESFLYKSLFNNIKYIASKYWSQDYNFILAIMENKNLLLSPKNPKSITRKQIKKVISSMKIRLDENRKSPISSASFYKAGTYKMGLDNNIWYIKNGKWNQVKDEIKKIKIVVPFNDKSKSLNILSYVGEKNTNPAFILNRKISKKNIELEILCTIDLVNSFSKLIPK